MRKFFPLIALCATMMMAQTCPTDTPPAITSSNAATFTETQAGTFTVIDTGSPTPTVTEAGGLPGGVLFVGNVLSGTPVLGSAGSYTLNLTAANGVLPNATQSFTLSVLPAPVQTGMWTPPLKSDWQWQLDSPPTTANLNSFPEPIYDVDGFDNSASQVSTMHGRGIHVICYVDVGTWEPGRADSASFPASVKGNSVQGFRSEKWLDVRQSSGALAILKPIMTARFQMCKTKGFDAVEPDNMDGYTNNPGFPTTAADQLVYNEWVAGAVHALGLSVAQKNDTDQVNSLVPFFDFIIVEQCAEFSECNAYKPYVNAGKAVFAAEYNGNVTKLCATLNAANFNGIKKSVDLTASPLTECR